MYVCPRLGFRPLRLVTDDGIWQGADRKIWASKLRRVREVASAGARAEAHREMAVRDDWATELRVAVVLDGFSDSTRQFRAILAPIAAGGRGTRYTRCSFLGVANTEGSERTVPVMNEMGGASLLCLNVRWVCETEEAWMSGDRFLAGEDDWCKANPNFEHQIALIGDAEFVDGGSYVKLTPPFCFENGEDLMLVLVPNYFGSRFSGGGSFGLSMEKKFMGIEFDVAIDEKVGDLNMNHIHVGSFVSVAVVNVCSIDLVLNSGEKLKS
ncbi:Concanavalin A-like lectin/glucanase domain containing protein [Trema orientale]|uniref:Concanavalin A-like lectin/glucanase domain containing protein n=1 Tax=Trema orientale TaxID=63057 RepID=A0A2P5FF67_TREOI|nr:Concanavalin A-like lectin/glucanase domain containing protein [Trema orientale]